MRKRNLVPSSLLGFTLIELLIVVAIIAILAAIAVPNFLEAQTRSKTARSLADMRSLATAIESYRVDDNKLPPCDYGPQPPPSGRYEWWGYVPSRLTSPIAYITHLPVMPFMDDGLTAVWISINPDMHTEDNQTYTYVWDITPFTRRLPVSSHYGVHPGAIAHGVPDSYDGPGSGLGDFIVNINKAGYLLYTCGPDRVDSTVWLCPSPYDASNGTTSFATPTTSAAVILKGLASDSIVTPAGAIVLTPSKGCRDAASVL